MFDIITYVNLIEAYVGRIELKNYAWRLGKKDCVTYLEDRKLAAEIMKILKISSSHSPSSFMATYYSPGGKQFAWQIRFGAENWELVTQALGIEEIPQNPPFVNLKDLRRKKKSQRQVTHAAEQFFRNKCS